MVMSSALLSSWLPRLGVVILLMVEFGRADETNNHESSPPLNDGSSSSSAVEISYVMEPFESFLPPTTDGADGPGTHLVDDEKEWFQRMTSPRRNSLTLSSSFEIDDEQDALFGSNALQINYTVIGAATQQGNRTGGTLSFVEFGKIQRQRPHNCHGATHLSLWYRHEAVEAQADDGGAKHLIVSLWDDTQFCLQRANRTSNSDYFCDPTLQDLQQYDVMSVDLEAATGGSGGWQELKALVTSATAAGLNLRRLRGWSVRIEATSNSAAASGILTVDQLECVGGGDLFGAVFYLDPSQTFYESVEEGTWKDEYFQSNASRYDTVVTSKDGLVDIHYAIEHAASWGGVTSFVFAAPGSAYYNLTYGGQRNNHIAINYTITEAVSVHGPAILRILLMDNSHCMGAGDCDDPNVHERYYSFHKILELDGEDAQGQLQVPLVASTVPGEPFWFTGWSGGSGNRELDPDSIKGFIIEFVLDNSLEIGDFVHGAVELSSMTVLNLDEPGGGYFQVTNECVLEPQLHFSIDDAPPDYFTRISFIGNKCCQTCSGDPECLYAFTDGNHCWMSHSKSSGLVIDDDTAVGENHTDGFLEHADGLEYDFSFVTILHVSEGSNRLDFETYWMDDAEKRGSYCELCRCNKRRLSIDCRDAGLHIPPKVFAERWRPRTLDLRGNPELFMMGSGSLLEVASGLEELYLPVNMRHVSSSLFRELPALTSVKFEYLELYQELWNGTTAATSVKYHVGSGVETLNNAVVHEDGAFSDVCCSRGSHFAMQTPANGFTFCNLVPDGPGMDSTVEPYVEYVQARAFMVIFPSSDFLSEATESWEKCAAYCEIFPADCRYWNYDARVVNTDHKCRLLRNNGTRSEVVCCNEEDYADENQTLPGWMAGVPPQTRHIVDQAKVLVRSEGGYLSELVASPETGYSSQYELSLGSTPLRGAVWVRPRLTTRGSTRSALDPSSVTIRPSRVVLYDSIMTGVVTVTVDANALKPGESTTLVIQNDIESCDAAFLAQTTDNLVYIEVTGPAPPDANTMLAIAISVPVVLVFVVLVTAGVFVLLEVNRRNNDTMWKIDAKELNWPDPIQIVGRGTFGMVLQAEYRGTLVAVKRVIPPQFSDAGSSGKKKNSAFATAFGFFSFAEPSTDTKEAAPAASGMSSKTRSGSTSAGSWQIGLTSWTEKSGRHLLGERTGSLRQSSSRQSGTQLDDPDRIERADSFEHDPQYSTRARTVRSDRSRWRKQRTEFIAEMRYLSKLRHPCITTVMGAVIDRDVEPMMVMELMQHGSLYDILHNETMFIDEGEIILPILQDISQGLRFLHAADPQVVHGDLKAANILVDSKFRGKVADFGLSNRKAQREHSASKWRRPFFGSSTSRATAAGGTPFWMAPELLRGESSNTPASDIYSFGIIMFECFSRQDPYQDEKLTVREILQMVASKTVNKRPSPIPPNCPHDCRVLMKECLHGSPSKRPTAVELDKRLRLIEVKPRDVAPGSGAKHNLTLFDIFPKRVAEALRDGRPVEPEHRDCVTIFFSDIVGYTNISAAFSSPSKVADMLGRLYGKFDQLSEKHNIFKVETIGDAYMAVTNLVEDQPDDHAKRIAMFAIDAIKAANSTLIDTENPELGFVNIRVGFHSGPVVADVVGSRNPRYTLFGDTVNTASRMESNSASNRIHCSAQSADLLRVQYPKLTLISRGMVSIKGKGEMLTYWCTDASVSTRRLSKDRQDILMSIASRAPPPIEPKQSSGASARRSTSGLSGISEEESSEEQRQGEFGGMTAQRASSATNIPPNSNIGATDLLEIGASLHELERNASMRKEITLLNGNAQESMTDSLLREAKRRNDRIKQLEDERDSLAEELRRLGIEPSPGDQWRLDYGSAEFAA